MSFVCAQSAAAVPPIATATAHQPSRFSSRETAQRPAARPAIPTAIGPPSKRTSHGGSASQKASRPSPMPYQAIDLVSASRRSQLRS